MTSLKKRLVALACIRNLYSATRRQYYWGNLYTSINDVKACLWTGVTTIFQQSRSKLHSSSSWLTFVSKASEEPIVTATCCSRLSDSLSSRTRPTSWHGWTRRRTSANSESKQQKQLRVIQHVHHAPPASHIGPFYSDFPFINIRSFQTFLSLTYINISVISATLAFGVHFFSRAGHEGHPYIPYVYVSSVF